MTPNQRRAVVDAAQTVYYLHEGALSQHPTPMQAAIVAALRELAEQSTGQDNSFENQNAAILLNQLADELERAP